MSPEKQFEHQSLSMKLESATAAKPEIVAPAPLVGTWRNTNSATRDIVEIIISASGAKTSIHVFGACSPKPCDWGTAPALSYSSGVSSTPAIGFTAQYKFSFSSVILTGRLNDGAVLTLESYTHFTDGSGRNDYCATMQMKK